MRCPGVCLLLLSAAAAAQTVEFNRDIRPILSDKCFTCHGPDAANRKTKLRFDTESGAKIELAKGRLAIVPGHPEQSEMYRRITTDHKIQRMPPAYMGGEKLAGREIDLIRRWIEQGAQWQPHWSFLPPVKKPLPDVRAREWPRNPIDHFVLARLEQEGLSASPEAPPETLLRRVTLDLTGLPPTPGELRDFLRDPSPAAYERVVDRLLASSGYAERMAFRWMEAARYADTNGYQTDGIRQMWRWRDWVIDAFHRNMPFDRFTVEQIAGDLLPNATLEQHIATAFHRNHRTSAEGGIVPEEFRVEYVADRAETTSTVWLGLTMGCARCHDHKYDPISQRDFYRMFAFFNNVPEKGLVYNWGNDEPLIKAPTAEQQLRLEQLDRRVAELDRRWQSLQPKLQASQREWERRTASGEPDWTLRDSLVFHSPGESRFDGKRSEDHDGESTNFDYLDPFTFAAWINPEGPEGAILSRYEDYFEGSGHGLFLIGGKLRLHVIFRWTDIGMRIETAEPLRLNQWQHVSVTYDGKRYASGVRMYVDGRPVAVKVLFDELNWPMKRKLSLRVGAGAGLFFKGGIRDARVYAAALTPAQAAILPLRESVSELAAMPAGSRTPAQQDKLRFCFLERAAPKKLRRALDLLVAARLERDRFHDTIPTLMVMKESAEPRPAYVLKRGAYDAPGEKVTPGTPAVLPPLKPEWPQNRLGLARWVVDPANPLPARVAVNRFWQMYFGTGLVKTAEDFGSQGEWPLHPELLDWLAAEFRDSGWDVKAFQKLIVTSATYRQSSRVTPELLQRDPENRLLARGPRLRLGPEAIRDQALAVSGLLIEKTGGPSVKPYQPPGLWQELAGGGGYIPDKGEGLYRRSLYTFWKRTIPPPFMTNFDSPSRETCTVRETRTNTPLQALNLMNDVTFLEASRKLAERVMRDGGSRPEKRIDCLYRLVLARSPKPHESESVLALIDRFRKRYGADTAAAAAFLAHGESAGNPKLEPAELAAYTAAASLVLNLDEAATKE